MENTVDVTFNKLVAAIMQLHRDNGKSITMKIASDLAKKTKVKEDSDEAILKAAKKTL
jgi:hypothetical protein